MGDHTTRIASATTEAPRNTMPPWAKVPREVIIDRRLTDGEFRLLCLLIGHTKDGIAFPGNKKVVELLGISKGEVRKRIHRLVELGLVRRLPPCRGKPPRRLYLPFITDNADLPGQEELGVQGELADLRGAPNGAGGAPNGDPLDAAQIRGGRQTATHNRSLTDQENRSDQQRAAAAPAAPAASRTPNGVSESVYPLIERFLGASRAKEQVAAFMDLGRSEGFDMKGGRSAAIIKRHGHGQKVVDALMLAAARRALEPHDYIEAVLRNARLQEAGRRPRGGARVAAAAGPDMDAWKRYAAGEG